MSQYLERIISLAEHLHDNLREDEAKELLASVLEVTEVSPIGVITPGHPLYDRVRSLLHKQPSNGIEQLLDSFRTRLTL